MTADGSTGDASDPRAVDPAASPPTQQPQTESPESRRIADGMNRSKLIIVVSIAVIAVLGVVLAFFLGNRIAAPAPAPTPTRTASATPTPTPSPSVAVLTGTRTPGEYRWDELGGGECLDPFVSVWELRFTVVDCGQPHPAQLVTRGDFSTDPAAPYPGEQALTSQLNLLCAAPQVIDYGAAGGYSDVQLQASYPADEASWAEGKRSYFCFATLAGGGALTSSIAVPRP